MKEHKILETIAKLYLSIQYAEGQLYVIKDNLKRKAKYKCNSAIKSVQSLCKEIESIFKEYNLEDAEDDVEMIDTVINLLIDAEKQGVRKEVINKIVEDVKILLEVPENI